MLEMFSSPQFWVDVFKIIVIDLLLSGDNAVVIALACRNLPPDQRKKGIMYGVIGAIGLRIVLTFFAVSLLALPYLKLIGAFLLLWIGIKLILPSKEEHGNAGVKAVDHLWGAVKTIILADLVMSLDNVIGVAGAAHGNAFLLVFGLLISIPLIAWSSQLVLKLIDRFPFVVDAGAALLGYVAGEMLASEVSLHSTIAKLPVLIHLIPVLGAIFVLVIGKWLGRGKKKSHDVVDLVDEKISVSRREK
jgi:YjbE family integral membrane protein